VDEAVLVEGLPSFNQFVDSLTRSNLMVAKWAINNDSIIYGNATTIDWKKELEVLRKTNVNHLRYRDSYDISEVLIGGERKVLFIATSEDQEVRKMEIRMKNGRVIYYSIDKTNNSLFSSSDIHFEFRPSQYILDLDQKINWVFNNQQYVVGNIMEAGDLWRVNLHFEKKDCPVTVVLNENRLVVKNGVEMVGYSKGETKDDSMVFHSDHFNSTFIFKTTSDNSINGRWINRKKDHPYSVAISGKKNTAYRFKVTAVPTNDVSGSHAAVFFDDEGTPTDTVELRLSQQKHIVTGSILTETGDYRFLEGVVRNDSLLLSTMDGTHAYLFEASIDVGVLNGVYCTGTGYKQRWSSTLNSESALRSPESITAAMDSVPIQFSFPSLNGPVSLSDSQFKNKPVIVSIMGTWCSNCLDESIFLRDAYRTYHDKGLEVIALDFELVSDSTRAFQNIEKHINSLDIGYPVLLASVSSTKKRASELMPALSEIVSYPTMVLLDRNHEIVRVHTGFNGPATGSETYDAFRLEYLQLIDSLVSAP